MESQYDLIIQNALVFDGSGRVPSQEDIAVKNGMVAARGENLTSNSTHTKTVDASGKWLMPGLLDIHTHMDLELELNTKLEEVVRHGTTTCIVGNCSIGAAYGSQRHKGEDPILDCFARVENIPKNILERCVKKMDWTDSAGYLEHLKTLPLGPNIAPLLPHSMIRIEVMGTKEAISRQPTEDELQKMEALLEKGMEQGYIGYSTDNIPFHYLANEPNTDFKIPSAYASHEEHKRLLNIVRKHERVWQATPDAVNRLGTLRRFLYTSGRLFGKPLRTSALTAIDLVHDRGVWKVFLQLAKFLNSWIMKGKFHFQVVAAPFMLWAEGAISPIFEEFEATRSLLACDIGDKEGRQKILSNPNYIKRFEKDWYDKKIVSTFQRDLKVMEIDSCPVPEWCGETGQMIFDRLQKFQAGDTSVARSEREYTELNKIETRASEARFFLHLLKEYDRDIRWHMVVGNDRPEVLEKMLFDENTLPGFNDSGAHLINLAFFDGNLLTLQIAQKDSLEKVAVAVRRLTKEPAEFFGMNVGTLDIGAQADITIIDPRELKDYDSVANRKMVYREVFDAEQLVNRSDNVVSNVFIAGTEVWKKNEALEPLGKTRLGRHLTFHGRPNEL